MDSVPPDSALSKRRRPSVPRRVAAVLPLLPGLVLAGGLFLSWVAFQHVRDQRRAEVVAAFDFRVDSIESRIRARLESHEQLLRGVAGLFNASAEVNIVEFRRYVAALHVNRTYPGLQGVGFAPRVESSEIQDFIDSMQAQGLDGYDVWPRSDATLVGPIGYLFPLDWRNRKALGYDMFSDPVRRAAMERAMIEGTTAMTSRVILKQEASDEVQAGFLTYVPIYRRGAPVDTIAQRRANLIGWAYAPYRAANFMRALLGRAWLGGPTPISIQVYDGATAAPDTLLYDSRTDQSDAYFRHQPRLQRELAIRFGGHVWTLQVQGTPALEARMHSDGPVAVLATGSGLSVLLAMVLWLLAHGRARAYAMARDMTHELAESERRFRALADAAPVSIWVLGADLTVEWTNAEWIEFSGLHYETQPRGLPAEVHPDDREEGRRLFTDAIRRRVPFETEIRVRDRHGRFRWLYSRALPRLEPNGDFAGFLGISVDITERKEGEQQLIEANNLVNSVLAAATEVGIVATDREGTITLFSQGAEAMLGYSAEEVVGHHTPALFHIEEEVDRYARAVSDAEGRWIAGFEVLTWEAQKSGQATHEWTLERKDGARLRVSLSVTLLRDSSGESRGWMGLMRDITAQVEAERQLTESERRLRAIFNSSSNIVALMTPTGSLLEINEPALAAVGVARGDVLGLPFWRTPWWQGSERTRLTLREALAHAGSTGNVVQYSLALVLPTGTRTLEASIRPVLDEQGAVVMLVFEGLDNTERKRAEQRLAEQRQFLDRLMAEIPEMVSYWDQRQICRFANVAFHRTFAASGQLLVGESMATVLGELYADLAADVDVVLGGAVKVIERTLVRDGGEVRHLLAHYVPDQGAAGIQGFILVLTDVTGLKQIERSLQEQVARAENATRAKSDFLANMSHEIRTPMNAVLGLSRLLGDTELNGEQRDYVDKIHSSSRALLHILNDILDYSKVEAGRLDLEKTEFELDSVLENLADLFAVMAEEKQLDLIFDVAPDVPARLIGDGLRLGQVLNNLIGNAVKFTARGTIQVAIDVAAHASGRQQLCFAVRDSGIGMSAEQLVNLFQPFHQADSSTTRRFGGTGLGLAICRRLVHLMEGDIGVESMPGEGSRFWFTAWFGAAPDAGRPAALSPMEVLLASERPLAARALRRSLEGWALTVSEAGVDALPAVLADAVTAARVPRVVILDPAPATPLTDQLQWVRQVRSAVAGETSPSILLVVAAHGRERFLDAAGDAPPDGLVRRPITPSRLHHALAALQRGRSLQTGAPPARRWHLGAAPIAGARILLAEDNPINQQVAVAILRKMGLTVDVVGTGREAVAHALGGHYDAVLMDLQMPEMDGFEAAALIRQEAGGAKLPIIAMTAAAMSEDRAATIAAGMNGHVAKPVIPEELLDELLKWIPPRSG